jgi:flagellar motor switch protein FliG
MSETLPVQAATAPPPAALRGRGAPRPANVPAAPIQKAAIILTAIGPDFASGVLRDVSTGNLKRFAEATASLGTVSQDVLDAVIMEFLDALTRGGDISGGTDAARRLLGAVLDESEIAALLGDGAKPQLSVWERLASAPVASLAGYVANEHPQTAAVILSELKPEMAASVLERLDRGFAREVVLRLSRVPSLDRRSAEAVTGAIERDFLSALQRSLSKRRPAELIAGLMNNISSEAREGFLSHLEASEPELAADVQRTMFTFADIATRLAGKDIGLIVREIPEETLLAALKFGQMQGSESVGFVFENIPRRLGERYVEELQNMPDVSKKEGEAAQIELTKRILALQKAGSITFLDREEG